MTIRPSSLALTLVLATASWSFDANAADIASVYVFDTQYWDSNLFRYSSKQAALQRTGERRTDDTYNQLGMGATLRLPISRQFLMLDMRVYDAWYHRNEFLNYRGGDAQGLLNWEIGRLFTGKLGVEQTRTITAFEYFTVSERNIRTVSHQYANALMRGAAPWGIELTLDRSDLDYSSEFFKSVARTTDMARLDAKLFGNDDSFVGLGFQHSTTEFPYRDFRPGYLLDNHYWENALRLSGSMKPREYSRVRAHLRVLDHRNQHLDNRDYTGVDGRIDYDQSIFGVGRAQLSAFRELNAIEDVRVDHVDKLGGAVNVTLPFTAKVRGSAGITGALLDYHGLPGAVSRKDGLITWQADVSYDPMRVLNISAGLSGGYRNSTIDVADFRYTTFFAKVQATF